MDRSLFSRRRFLSVAASTIAAVTGCTGPSDTGYLSGGPSASFTASPSSGFGPALVKIVASPTVGAGGGEEFRWDIGGETRQGRRLFHPIEPGESHQVDLEVTDGGGRSAATSQVISLQVPMADDYPETGERVPELSSFDDALKEFMEDHRITSGTLGVARDGEVLIERGYGWKDRELTESTEPDTLFRIGSVTKTMAAAAVKSLMRESDLDPKDRVLDRLDLEPLPGDSVDERIYDVTVRHLLDHRGGWDRGESFDPLFHQFEIAEAMELTEPPTPRQIARYMMGKPLQFDPGERKVYSNFGYTLLGLLVEEVAGTTYWTYLRDSVLKPNGVEDVQPGRTIPGERNPRESRYFDPNVGPDVKELDRGDLVHLPDGGIHLESMVAVGDLVASVRGLLSFMNAFWLNGEPRGNGEGHWFFYGSLPGTFSMAYQTPNGVDVAVLFNRRGEGFDDLRNVIDGALGRTSIGP